MHVSVVYNMAANGFVVAITMSDNIYCVALLPCCGRANNGLHTYHRHVFT